MTAPSLPGLVPDFVSSRNTVSPAHPFPGAEPLTRPPGSAPRFEIQSAGRLGFSSGSSSRSAKKSKDNRVSRPVDWSQGWFEDSAGVGGSGVGSGENGGSYIGGGHNGVFKNNSANSVDGGAKGERYGLLTSCICSKYVVLFNEWSSGICSLDRMVGHLPTKQNTRQQVFGGDSDEQQFQRRAVQTSNGFVGVDALGGNQEGTDFKEYENTNEGVVQGGTTKTTYDPSSPEFLASASQEHGELLGVDLQQQLGNSASQSALSAATDFNSMQLPECGTSSISEFDSLPPSVHNTSLPFAHAASQSPGTSAPTSLEHDLSSHDATRPFEPELSALINPAGDYLMVPEVNIQPPSKRTVLSPLERNASLSFDNDASQLPRRHVLQTKQPNFDVLPSSVIPSSNPMENESLQSSERNALPQSDSDKVPQENSGVMRVALPLDRAATLQSEGNAVISSESDTTPLLNSDTTPAPENGTLQPSVSNAISPSGGNSSVPSNLDNSRQAAPSQFSVKDIPPGELSVPLPSSELCVTTPFEVASVPSPRNNLLKSSEQNASSLTMPYASTLAESGLSSQINKKGAPLSCGESTASQTSGGNVSPSTGGVPVLPPQISNTSQALESTVSPTSERNASSLSEPRDSTSESASVPLEHASSQSEVGATQLQKRRDLSLVEPALPGLTSETYSVSSPANMDSSQPNLTAVPSLNFSVATADTLEGRSQSESCG